MATRGQSAQQKTRFLETFRVTGNVLRSCQSAGVARSSIYKWLEIDEKFSLAYHQAERDAEDVLERAAWDRATRGRTKRVYWQGKLVEETQEPSDLLLMFLLKARNPAKYRENRFQVEHSGPGGGPIRQQHEVKTLEYDAFADAFADAAGLRPDRPDDSPEPLDTA